MKNKYLRLIIFLAMVLVFLIAIVIANPLKTLKLKQGKNNVTFNNTLGYASDFIKSNPEISSISYKHGNASIGYVNVFGGIGKNFILEQNKTYEIIAKINTTIYIK